jgi:hypothetical protein
MAEAIISPGVFTRENDQSFLTQQPIQAGAAIIGPTVKGPVEKPTLVTSYSDYKNKFGATFVSGGLNYSYFTSIAAFNYFNNGGNTLLITRITNGDFTSAQTADRNDDEQSSNIAGTTMSSSADLESTQQPALVLKTIAQGTIMNSSGSGDSNGALLSSSYGGGTSDNIRWEISQRDTGSGTFTLLIRQGSDKDNEKSILETYSNVSLDPFSDNYVAKVIGDQRETVVADTAGNSFLQISGSYPNLSRYVYVDQVYNTTPQYFDNSGNPKEEFKAYLPKVAKGSFSQAEGDLFGAGAAFYENITSLNIQGLSGGDYATAINLLSNRDAYQFNSLIMPGLTAEMTGTPAARITEVLDLANVRGDFIAVLDMVNYGTLNTSEVTNEASTFDTSYAATYWPWCQVQDPDLGKNVWVPASTLMPSVFAFNDNNAEPWFAPAGLNRGALPTVIRTERILTKADRDALYSGKVNPIATFPNTGVVVFGQKTLQKRASALDRVNVRRLLIQLKSFIGQLAQNLVFEQNSTATRNAFLSEVNPYLESVQQKQGLYAFRVVMDDSNNTPDVVDRNQLVGQIFLQPTKTAEFIVLDFNVLPTGAEFPS